VKQTARWSRRIRSGLEFVQKTIQRGQFLFCFVVVFVVGEVLFKRSIAISQGDFIFLVGQALALG
jgi:hypothetical protein